MTAFDQLREGLRDAARRDVARAKRRRRRTRLAAALALAVVGGGAVADATNVFDSGPTAPDIRGQLPRYAPGQGERRQIVVKLRVDGTPLPFGVAVYETGEGRAGALQIVCPQLSTGQKLQARQVLGCRPHQVREHVDGAPRIAVAQPQVGQKTADDPVLRHDGQISPKLLLGLSILTELGLDDSRQAHRRRKIPQAVTDLPQQAVGFREIVLRRFGRG